MPQVGGTAANATSLRSAVKTSDERLVMITVLIAQGSVRTPAWVRSSANSTKSWSGTMLPPVGQGGIAEHCGARAPMGLHWLGLVPTRPVPAAATPLRESLGSQKLPSHGGASAGPC